MLHVVVHRFLKRSAVLRWRLEGDGTKIGWSRGKTQDCHCGMEDDFRACGRFVCMSSLLAQQLLDRRGKGLS
jgi:hypothetical protein